MRTMMLRGTLLLAGLLSLAAPPALAQNLVKGTVVDGQNKPVDGATIHFEATKFVNKRDTKTDRKGTFLFQGLQSGEYTVTASKDGVGTQTKNITVSSSSALETLTFTLAPAAAATTPVTAGGLTLGTAPAKAADKETAAIQATAASAMEAYKAERYEESATKLNEVVAKLTTCADCFLYLGQSYYQLKKYDEAEAALKKSIEISPTVEAYTALTRYYNQQKKYDLAAEMSQKASDLASAPAPLAPAPAGAGAKPAAGTGATGAAAATPPPAPTANSETLYNQGVVLWNAGKYAEAKAQFEAAVKANPGNAEAQYQLGMAHLNLGELPQARTAFEGYLKAAPDGPKAAEVKTFITQLPK
jgi:tetratricopeptide (TPR) repeat protein